MFLIKFVAYLHVLPMRLQLVYLVLLSGLSLSVGAQSRRTTAASSSLPEFSLTRTETETHLRFLAADELMGRRTGEPGNLVAARYIAEQFRALGLKKPGGQPDYYQTVPLLVVKPVATGMMIVGKDTLKVGNQFVVIAGSKTDLTAGVVYAGYGLTDGEDGYKGQEVKGKFVVTQVGSPDAKSPREVITAGQAKRKLAASKGAAGLIELVTGAGLPWGMASRYFGGESMSLPAAGEDPTQISLLHIWVDNSKNQLAVLKEPGQSITVRTTGRPQSIVNAVNVAGLVEGSDPKLKNEYVLLTAHFDHIGTARKGSGVTGTDTIYNGARDNAMGTVALLDAAKALQARPPKRSVLIVALTGEEVGLLGSRYYAEHPLVPLKQTIFNLNIDGAGYNDTTLVSVIGLERTGAKAEIDQACKTFGMTTFNDPSPEQGLFDRSDNVSFAAKGIPAPTFSPGFKAFDETIQRNYHQVSDNPDTIDFGYLLKFCQAYANAARLIADKATRPQWSAGDKYEAAGQALYGR